MLGTLLPVDWTFDPVRGWMFDGHMSQDGSMGVTDLTTEAIVDISFSIFMFKRR